MDTENQTIRVCKNILESAGYNVDTPIIDALIGNLMGTLPTRSDKYRKLVKCDLCNCELPLHDTLRKHVTGNKHKKKLKSLCLLKEVQTLKEEGILIKGETYPKEIRCEFCWIKLNSPFQLRIHLSGYRHKKNKAKAISGDTSDDSDSSLEPNIKQIKLGETKHLTCNSCNILLNSPRQYKEHITSKKHLMKNKFKIKKKKKFANKRKFSSSSNVPKPPHLSGSREDKTV